MKHFSRLWESMVARRSMSMALCLALAVTSGGVSMASAGQLLRVQGCP